MTKFFLLILQILMIIQCQEQYFFASDQNIHYVGRTLQNSDGSRSFNWEATQINVNLKNATYVKFEMEVQQGISQKIIVELNGWEHNGFTITNEQKVYIISTSLDANVQYHIRIINILEPFQLADDSTMMSSIESNYIAIIKFQKIITDGYLIPVKKRQRSIEVIGDSISAGFGSRGHKNSLDSCQNFKIASGNYYTYTHYLAEYFNADLTVIAWSGKGLHLNAFRTKSFKMPDYYIQTIANDPNHEWKFSKAPDMIIINLGTNDLMTENNISQVDIEEFIDTYVQFVKRVVQNYYNEPDLNIFIAQGSMNNSEEYNQILNKVIKQLNNNKISARFLDLRGADNDGCYNHPGVEGNRQMFEMAKKQIEQAQIWTQNQSKQNEEL